MKFFTDVYYQLLQYVRVRHATFFLLIFPLLVFVLFFYIWGYGDDEDGINMFMVRFYLTGCIVMTVASSSIFAIGSIISEYYQSGEMKVFKMLPYSLVLHIFAVILSIVLIMLLSIGLLLFAARLIYHYSFTTSEIGHFFLATVMGVIVFSLIGSCLAVLNRTQMASVSLTNIVFYVMMFVSDCYYPLSEIQPGLARWLIINPFTPILATARGEIQWLPIALWTGFLLLVLMALMRKMEIRR